MPISTLSYSDNSDLRDNLFNRWKLFADAQNLRITAVVCMIGYFETFLELRYNKR